ncbi:MAG: amidohydrolase family protein, partial [Desulfobacterales bacterium]
GYIKEFKEFWHFLFEVQEIFLTELNNALVPLILGTDAGIGILGIVPGFCLHDELRVLTESGFTPYQAIATGTVNASKAVAAMSGRDDFGTIEVGKRADFILVNKNPLEDVGNIKDNCGVMAAGRWYSKSELQEMIALND